MNMFSETNRLDEGMIIELWSKGVLWDRLLGVHFMPLTDVRYWYKESGWSNAYTSSTLPYNNIT
ncbi:hypothetical protein TELCIR_13180 [Teladorsagia circumcincta]|uniref:Uncharacterized protein n=1 Tax=Teladorsagia circumcincta TaxID=45464 RepID=A0A2G9U4R1_TELCI|nr:hypothetical protein TELCIR_13180 [Teladorsagia circumcincta]